MRASTLRSILRVRIRAVAVCNTNLKLRPLTGPFTIRLSSNSLLVYPSRPSLST